MLRARLLLIAMTVTLVSCAPTQHKNAEPAKPAATAAVRANPLLERSTLLYQAPPFDKITDADYEPAIEEGMKRQMVEVEKIANNPAAPTFENTIEALERSGDLFVRATKVFFAITQANTNDTLQKIQEDEAPKVAAHADAIALNPKLFARVKAVYDARDSLDPEQKTVAEHYYRNFVRAGAKLSTADQDKLKELNKEESTLSTTFANKLLAATKNGALVVDSKDALAGFSESDLAAAEEAGKDR
ncbi:MAG TPA: dipeptidyl carboxypeptidase II, partial [Rudaea sp.]|nr:dipeptidyl carboxypeptidase II [Rudaea sp.]